ncbi:DNA-directed RNA polymerase subunit beta [Aciduricibacillus chroicocephali]|uniref:DNA-directed RNA polymerase subunit beta n=1 Tax=Aciduricibacillus chroicocephali TaxID=3054939 RepID=A0ABY9KV90_9BACI|nr:DNA-directed RNA polymerase subunit beta [Bacillaceae bacterium 44XB]
MSAAVDRVPASGKPAPAKGSRKQKRVEKGHSQSIPIWLRIVLLLTISLMALLIGAIIGYGVVGDGVPTDALKFDTWSHIVDLVTSRE